VRPFARVGLLAWSVLPLPAAICYCCCCCCRVARVVGADEEKAKRGSAPAPPSEKNGMPCADAPPCPEPPCIMCGSGWWQSRPQIGGGLGFGSRRAHPTSRIVSYRMSPVRRSAVRPVVVCRLSFVVRRSSCRFRVPQIVASASLPSPSLASVRFGSVRVGSVRVGSSSLARRRRLGSTRLGCRRACQLPAPAPPLPPPPPPPKIRRRRPCRPHRTRPSLTPSPSGPPAPTAVGRGAAPLRRSGTCPRCGAAPRRR